MLYRIQLRKVAIVMCAAVAMACEGEMRSPVGPGALKESSSALNADGSNLKVSAPIPLVPLFEATNQSLTPAMAAIGSIGRNVAGNAGLSYRFQVSESDSFETVVASGSGAVDASGIVRFTVAPALTAAKRYVWRVRAELGDAFGPWSNLGAFTTAGGGGTSPSPGPSPNAGPRPADPPPGQRLPLPDMQGVLARFSNASDSCPRGLKYVNNPWQDRVIDAFRQIDSRWGYNGKPTKSASVDNNGVPVTAAGDEAAYHYGGGASQGSFDVHLVDMLIGHCGASPSLTWRVFTGEEPGFWTGVGRF
jgi:hypothetical protein